MYDGERFIVLKVKDGATKSSYVGRNANETTTEQAIEIVDN